ncbi:hypothetical protein [Pseudoxanthomonas wuyuanensis]|nr:hypothetical protein [Pseudoxanthomonas wuyuanensis]
MIGFAVESRTDVRVPFVLAKGTTVPLCGANGEAGPKGETQHASSKEK